MANTTAGRPHRPMGRPAGFACLGASRYALAGRIRGADDFHDFGDRGRYSGFEAMIFLGAKGRGDGFARQTLGAVLLHLEPERTRFVFGTRAMQAQ